MAQHVLNISYSEDFLSTPKMMPEEVETEARLLLAVELYELGRLTTGRAAKLVGMGRVEFMSALGRFEQSPIGVDPEELKLCRRSSVEWGDP